jgi:hypothetical protein
LEVIALPYYWTRNPGLVRNFPRPIAEILADFAAEQ